MNGVLWFDNTPDRPLDAKLRRAFDYYERKHGDRPASCEVHPSTLYPYNWRDLDGVTLVPTNRVLPHHFFCE